MTEFSFLSAFSGGIMIGFATVLMFIFLGKITGISGIVSGLINTEKGQSGWRLVFILSLMVGGALYPLIWGQELPVELNGSWLLYIFAGILVGLGTKIGSGCTSGHGICGLARFSPRSMVATLTFIMTAVITHTLVRLITG